MKNYNIAKLGESLRQFRLSYNLTQEAVATELGIDQSTYSMMESGSTEWPVSRLYKLAEIYKVDPAHLLTYDRSMPIAPGSNYQSGNNNKYLNQTTKEIFELYERIIAPEKENLRLQYELQLPPQK
jgi:transcriptional regulator with XRE-family HTH domain